MMACYNQRMNNQFLTACSKLTETQWRENTNSFFPSIMHYWNHLLFGDLIMLSRIAHSLPHLLAPEQLAKFPKATAVDNIFTTSFEEIARLRKAVDEVIVAFTQNITDDDYLQTIRYTTTEGQAMSKALGSYVTHLFNHQTHHRGQLSCLLSQFNIDYGCTDLPVIASEF